MIAMDDFQQRTKNNGLKNVEWGSDEFKKKINHEEKRIEQKIARMSNLRPDEIVILE